MATSLRRGQAMMELAVGIFTLALVVLVLCGFATYVAKSLEVQNGLRVGGKRSDTVDVSSPLSEYVFGSDTMRISETLVWPQTTILR